jgi:uncharacterized LabA/DUF88 family protein
MQNIILIDGENLSYAIRRLLGDNDTQELAPRECLLKINYQKLVREASGLSSAQILFFGVRLRRYSNNKELENKTLQAINNQSRLVNILQKQGISFVKCGTLKLRDTEPCAECGTIKTKLTEKGVDVGLAVRMVTEAKPGTDIILISSDTDLIPAFLQAKKQGAKITFIGYEYLPILALSKQADRTRIITKELIQKCIV